MSDQNWHNRQVYREVHHHRVHFFVAPFHGLFEPHDEPAAAAERRTYQQLTRLGFRFEDLVKYNDYHSKDGPAGKVLNEVTWNKPDQYFAMVEKAYRTFYLRREFVSDFKQLIAAGY